MPKKLITQDDSNAIIIPYTGNPLPAVPPVELSEAEIEAILDMLFGTESQPKKQQQEVKDARASN